MKTSIIRDENNKIKKCLFVIVQFNAYVVIYPSFDLYGLIMAIENIFEYFKAYKKLLRIFINSIHYQK